VASGEITGTGRACAVLDPVRENPLEGDSVITTGCHRGLESRVSEDWSVAALRVYKRGGASREGQFSHKSLYTVYA